MIYGAYGFTAKKIAELTVAKGHTPILAGRNPEKLRAVAEAPGLDSEVFGLTDPVAIRRALEGTTVLVNCAGPFIETAQILAKPVAWQQCGH
jgi:short subunit dehydrogenase-like uncharacterized protein